MEKWTLTSLVQRIYILLKKVNIRATVLTQLGLYHENKHIALNDILLATYCSHREGQPLHRRQVLHTIVILTSQHRSCIASVSRTVTNGIIHD